MAFGRPFRGVVARGRAEKVEGGAMKQGPPRETAAPNKAPPASGDMETDGLNPSNSGAEVSFSV
jgi:hypothetical protein